MLCFSLHLFWNFGSIVGYFYEIVHTNSPKSFYLLEFKWEAICIINMYDKYIILDEVMVENKKTKTSYT